MRSLAIGLSSTMLSLTLAAQVPPPRGRMMRPPSMLADTAESAVKQATEQLVMLRKICDRDLEVLAHIRTADKALVDPMQPENALQKAWEEVQTAIRLEPEFYVRQGVIRAKNEIEGARRSPASADFGRLRAVLRNEALGPASRVVVRNALRLEDELVAWLKVQQLIGDHLRALSDISSNSLRASEEQ